MQGKALIEVQHRHVRIIDPDKLQAIADRSATAA
jgi:hypothetical protein